MKPKPGTSRRELITGGLSKEKIESRSDESAGSEAETTNFSRHQNSHLESYRKNAMACEFELLFNLHEYRNSAQKAIEAFSLIDSFENQMSVYKQDSLISQINRLGPFQSMSVEPRIGEVLSLAKEISRKTEGAFDITAFPLSEVWGFSRRSGKVPTQQQISDVLALVSSEFFELDNGSIRIAKSGVRLNLGGIGKGFAIDYAKQLLLQAGVSNFVIHGGQSSVIASGTCQDHDSPESEGWKIGLSHPMIPDCRLAKINLANKALGTSGTGRQGFFAKGRRFGHIIDPRTGWPTDHFLSTTVVADQAAIADALATAFFVMKIEDVRRFCDENKNIQAVLVVNQDNKEPKIEAFNFREDELEILRERG